MDDMNRRKFLGTVAGASAFTIVPRRVLGGPGYIAPSDMILLAQVGCGTQAQRQVNTGLVARPDLQFVAVVDPNRDSQNYVDWEPFGNRAAHPASSSTTPTWGASDTGIRAGPRRRPADHGDLLQEAESPGAGIRSYEDYREMLEKETDIQGIVNITPDHQHGEHQHLGAEEGQGRDLAQAGRERAARSAPDAAGRRARASAVTHLLAYSNTPDRHTLAAWINAGVIGTVREVHNWTNRPFWPQGMQEYYASGPPVPAGLQLGRCGRGPSRIVRTIRATRSAVYRGWYAYGAGCLGDMGHYSLWQPYRILNLGVPEFVEARPNNDAVVNEQHVSDGGHVSLVGLPKASTVRWRHPATAIASVGRHVLVRRRHEAADARGAVRGQRGSRRRGHALHRRQGQDPLRLPRATSRASFRRAVRRRSKDRSSRTNVDTTTRGRRVGERDQEPARSRRAASSRSRRSPKP